ncbi:hypothetical protein [Petropleomorpha daqingensis]|uniref:Uncharacterized protein n=1 Tax=Petropleomorpha daqingensis TaxID=2026353 RepID=A0A853CLR2_9ACTN|nr:hypothetical protein [Petropleomorpha daqingensis]NYJ07472.1 hypothetical protein [Petropleomorpha daqingensis]
MSVEIDLDGEGTTTFPDADLPAGRYCYHVGAGGALIVLVEENGESRVDRVYGPTAWQSARGDVWRKGVLLRG